LQLGCNGVVVLKEKFQMFARNAHFRLKSLALAAEFARTFENEILPLLRTQAGFNGEITLSNPGSLEQIAISLWENKDDAEAYNADLYPQILQILAKLIVGTPKIRTYEAVTLSLDHGSD
jgi:heme-degrading monooxygenase HmoA